MEQILTDEINGVKVIKILDKANMKLAPKVIEILDSCGKTPIFDLSETTYIDSTFLGLIAKYTMIFKSKSDEFLSILRPSSEVLTCLNKTGILKFLIILDKDININGKVVKVDEIDNQKLAKHILELHTVLMNLNEANRKEFGKVVELMKKGSAKC